MKITRRWFSITKDIKMKMRIQVMAVLF